MNKCDLSNESIDRGLKALQHGERGYSCSEAIMLTFGNHTGLDPEMSIKLASGLGGGVGLSGEICGAALAACLVIGAAHGTADPKKGYQRQNTYLMVQEYLDRFCDRFGSVVCRDLCYSRLGPGQGFAQVRNLNLATELIRTGAELLDELLDQHENAA
jgi:C_GCAxxG_C_C family probable redox protein